jgi:hypothetical protein
VKRRAFTQQQSCKSPSPVFRPQCPRPVSHGLSIKMLCDRVTQACTSPFGTVNKLTLLRIVLCPAWYCYPRNGPMIVTHRRQNASYATDSRVMLMTRPDTTRGRCAIIAASATMMKNGSDPDIHREVNVDRIDRLAWAGRRCPRLQPSRPVRRGT